MQSTSDYPSNSASSFPERDREEEGSHTGKSQTGGNGLPVAVEPTEYDRLGATCASSYFAEDHMVESSSEIKKSLASSMSTGRIDLEHAQIPVAFAKRYFMEKAIRVQNRKDLVLEIILFILFVFMLDTSFLGDRELFYGAYDIRRKIVEMEAPPTSYLQANADPSTGLHFRKSFETILKPADWERWFRDVLIPFYFDPQDPDKSPQDVANFRNLQMLPLGGIRIRTLRVRNDSCIPTEGSTGLFLSYFVEGRYSYANGACYGHFKDSSIDTRDIAIPGTSAVARYESCNGEIRKYYGYESSFPCAGNILDLTFNMSYNEASAIAASMVNSGYFDGEATRLISVHTMHALPSSGALTMALYYAEVGPGGHIFPYYQLYTNKLIGLPALGLALAVFLWCSLLILKDFGRAVFDCAVNRIFNAHVGGPLLFALFVRITLIVLSSLTIAAYVLSAEAESDTDALDSPSGRFDFYSVELEVLMQYYYAFRYMAAACSILMCFRLIYFLQIIRRLRVLSMVLLGALPYIVGILLYFIAVLIPLFVAGMYLYGSRLVEYSSLSRSIETVALIIVGDFDYRALEEVHPTGTFFYFWAVNILTLFLLINFIMAILSFTFRMLITKQDKEREESLIAQAQRNSNRPGVQQYDVKSSVVGALYHGWSALRHITRPAPAWNILRVLHEQKQKQAAEAKSLQIYKDDLDGTFNERTFAARREELDQLSWVGYPLFQLAARRFNTPSRELLVMFEGAYIAYMAVEKAEKAIELDEAPEVSHAMHEGLRAFLTVLEASTPNTTSKAQSLSNTLRSLQASSTFDPLVNPSFRFGGRTSVIAVKPWSAVIANSGERVLNEVHRVVSQAALFEAANLAFLDVRMRYAREDLVAAVVARIATTVAHAKASTNRDVPFAVAPQPTHHANEPTTTSPPATAAAVPDQPTGAATEEGTELSEIAAPDVSSSEVGAVPPSRPGITFLPEEELPFTASSPRPTTDIGHYELLLSCTDNAKVLRDMVMHLGVGTLVYPRKYRAEKSKGVRAVFEYLEENGLPSDPQDEVQHMLNSSSYTQAPAVTKNAQDKRDEVLVPILAEGLRRIKAGEEAMIDEERFDGHWRRSVLTDTVSDDSSFNQEHELLEALLVEQVSLPAMAHDAIVKLILKDDDIYAAFEERYLNPSAQ